MTARSAPPAGDQMHSVVVRSAPPPLLVAGSTAPPVAGSAQWWPDPCPPLLLVAESTPHCRRWLDPSPMASWWLDLPPVAGCCLGERRGVAPCLSLVRERESEREGCCPSGEREGRRAWEREEPKRERD